MSEKNELKEVSSDKGSIFLEAEAFEHAQRVCQMLAKSPLVPTTFQGKVENCMIALEMARRIGASPLMVMQNMYIINGRPAWGSQFLIATFNASGKFSSIRYEEDKKEGGRTRAICKDLATGEDLRGVWVSMNTAKGEGWLAKNGSKWKTMPELMRRYRAAAFLVRQFAPEFSMGLMTQEEVVDIGTVEDVPAVEVVEQKKATIKKRASKGNGKGGQQTMEMP